MIQSDAPSPVCNRPVGKPLGASFVSSKLEVRHLALKAVVYVRQSSMRQVRENIESTQLQYDLVRRVEHLGWKPERVEVIDDDLGVSGSSTQGRTGFQRLLAEVSLGHVGIVMGIEMSRLARNCRDWHQLLELCAVFGALLGDADGVYNPRDHNDRLLLGLKGTMSEAELHVLKSRLHAGKKNKAARGEHFTEAPIGYIRTREGIVLETDAQVQNVVRLVFDKFSELGSAHGVLRYLFQEKIFIGLRRRNGLYPDAVTWHTPNRSTIHRILTHPVYAGAYAFGRTKCVTTSTSDGQRKVTQCRQPRDSWDVLIRDKVPAYITWEQWEANQRKLRQNSTKFGFGASRGSSLLTGRITCGKCGGGMTVHYRGGQCCFECSAAHKQYGLARCQSFSGRRLEGLVEQLILKAMTPACLELSLSAASEIALDRSRLATHHQQTVERATYQAELARRRYEEVDPSNRLVASELEKRWETALLNLRQSEEELNRFLADRPVQLSKEQQDAINDLSNDFSTLWNSEFTSPKDRQDLVRVLIDRVVVDVVDGTECLSIAVHWSGGFVSRHESRRSVMRFDDLQDAPQLLERASSLYDSGYPRAEILRTLNEEGFRCARNDSFTETGINALFLTLRRKGLIGSKPKLTGPWWQSGVLSRKIGIQASTLTGWRHRRWVQARQFGNRWIYWADNEEIERLRQLSTYAAGIEKPEELIHPINKMPS